MKKPAGVWYPFATQALRCLLAPLAALTLCIAAGRAQAQEPVSWDVPINLSDTPTSSEAPAIVADPYGMVHVFWGENLDDATPGQTNAIMYTRWDGQAWSPVRDILLAPDGIAARAGRVSAAFGKEEELYVVLAGGFDSSIYFSAAPISMATQAPAWRKPMMLNESLLGANEPWIAVDSEGLLHVVFCVPTGTDQGVYHSRSQDGGRSWTRPQQITGSWLGLDTSLFDTHIVVDASGTLHAAWSWAGFPDTFPPRGLWYARSTDKGETWSPPTLVADGPFSNPDLATQADGEIHLFWGGTQPQRFKFHQVSRDGGATWSQPWIFTTLGGLHGYAGAAEDSSGAMHLAMATNISGVIPEVLVHSQWDGSRWTAPEILLRDTHGFAIIDEDLVDVAMAVTQGNILHVVVQYPVVRVPKVDQQRDIFYLRGQAQAPHVEPIPLPTIVPTLTPTSTPIDLLSATSVPATADARPRPRMTPLSSEPAPTSLGTGQALGVGTVSVLLVLVMAALIQRWRR